MLSEDIFDCRVLFFKGVITNTANPFNESYLAPAILCLNALKRPEINFSVILNLDSILMSVFCHIGRQ